MSWQLTAADDIDADGTGSATTALGGSTLLTGLVAGWAMEEASGTRVDVTGRGNNLTDNNTVTQAAGKIGNAAQFTEANSEYLSKVSSADVEFGDIDWTISAWVYYDTVNNNIIVGKDSDVANGRDYVVEYAFGDSGHMAAVFIAPDTAKSVTAAGVPSTATWYFIMAWHDATANTINISIDNGAPVSSPTTGALQAASTTEFRIGARVYAGFQSYMSGRIDEVYIWKRLLTSAEKACLYNSGSGATYPFSGLCT